MTTNDSRYEGFNHFQSDFFTSVKKFDEYSHYEIGMYGYQLLNNISKGFPNLINIVINLKGIGWSGVQSPTILKALQYRFVNEFTSGRIPRFVFFKNNRERSSNKEKKELENSLKIEICNILMIDSKTFEYLQNSELITNIRKQIEGDIIDKKKKVRTKKIK